jgi:hypothetical protein
LKGSLFSDLYSRLPKKRAAHDTINATISTDRKLNSFSLVNKKKAFLTVCSKKADYIVFGQLLITWTKSRVLYLSSEAAHEKNLKAFHYKCENSNT